jgi:predicted nuclease of predicted toxin-antitoxin system
MNFLLDVPVSPTLISLLEAYGHGGVHVHQIGLHTASDESLLALARREHRIVITADLDFPRLLALSAANGPGLVLFRGGNYSEAEMRALLRRVLEKVSSEQLAQSVCVVDKRRIRLTNLPLR